MSSANIDEQQGSKNPEIELLLSPPWVESVIRQVGNYAEMFDRNLGPNTPLGMERGLNALWNDGSLISAIPPSSGAVPAKSTISHRKLVTLDSIISRGKLRCGTSNAFDTEVCRAVSVAIFGQDRTDFTEAYSAAELLPQLRNGSIDLIGGSLISSHLLTDRSKVSIPAIRFSNTRMDSVKKRRFCNSARSTTFPSAMKRFCRPTRSRSRISR